MDAWVVNLFLAGVGVGFIVCLCIVAFWDDFHAKREVKREERKAALRKKQEPI